MIRALEKGEKVWHDLIEFSWLKVQVHWYYHGDGKCRPWKPRRFGCKKCGHFAQVHSKHGNGPWECFGGNKHGFKVYSSDKPVCPCDGYESYDP